MSGVASTWGGGEVSAIHEDERHEELTGQEKRCVNLFIGFKKVGTNKIGGEEVGIEKEDGKRWRDLRNEDGTSSTIEEAAGNQ